MKKFVSLLFVLPYSVITLLAGVANLANAEGAFIEGGYIENHGQWEPNIRYCAQVKGMKVWVTTDALVYDVVGVTEKTGNIYYQPSKFSTIAESWKEETVQHRHAVRVELVGADLRQTSSRERLDGVYNYFPAGHQSTTAIGAGKYAGVVITEAYKGIDMVLGSMNGAPRYDFVVKPGASPEQIRLNVSGAYNLITQTDGSLRITTSCGDIINGSIFAYQKLGTQIKRIPCTMVANGTTVQFRLGEYDTNKELVIDPTVYATYLGGDDAEVINGIVRVPDRNEVVVVGYTQSHNFPKTTGAYTTTTRGLEDFFVAKLDANLQKLVFATYFGGSGTDIAYGVAVSKDDARNIYVCGTSGSSGLASSGVVSQLLRGNADAFLFKLSRNGDTRYFATYYGGTGNEYAYGVDVDADGSAYICGETSSNNIQTSSGAYSTTTNGGIDGFVAKVSSSGVLEYGSYLGGSTADRCNAIAVYNEQAYVTGETQSSNFPVQNPGSWWLPQPAQPKLNITGSGVFSDAFVSKFNAAGSQLPASTFLGGNADDVAYSIFIDNAGTALIGGMTKSTNIPLKRNLQPAKKSGADGLLAGVKADGTEFTYMTYFGGDGEDVVFDLETDGTNGSIYAVGRTSSQNFPITPDAGTPEYGGNSDGFIAKLAYDQPRYVSFVGDSLQDELHGVAMLDPMAVYIGGATFSRDMPVSDTSVQMQYLGNGDGYVAKYTFSSLTVATPQKDASYCVGTSVLVNWTGSVFSASEPYRVEVSSDNGVTWKTMKSNLTAASYNWSIPADAKASSQYRIRITHEQTGYAVLNPGMFTVRRSPEVLSRSADTTLCVGTAFSIAVSAVGDGIQYQWRKDGSELNGEIYPSLSIAESKLSDAGVYDVVVSGTCSPGQTSQGIRVTINPPPTITSHPKDLSVKTGNSAVFEVKVTGKNLHYRWQKDGATIAGAPSLSQYSIPNAQEIDQGSYRVIISGDCGSDTSVAAKLEVKKETVGVEETANESLAIQPNPSDEYIRVRISGLESNDEIKVRIINSLGNIVCSRTVGQNADRENVLIPVHNLGSGTYRVVVEQNNIYIAKGLVILH